MKDQKKLLIRCMKEEIPVVVISGNDELALDVVRYYLYKAKEKGCSDEFTEDFEMLVKHFQEHRELSPSTIKLPD